VISVLVVDDEVFNIIAFKLMLEGLDVRIDEAYNGQKAIEKVIYCLS
jgi:CheY-like chemotaxis protein